MNEGREGGEGGRTLLGSLQPRRAPLPLLPPLHLWFLPSRLRFCRVHSNHTPLASLPTWSHFSDPYPPALELLQLPWPPAPHPSESSRDPDEYKPCSTSSIMKHPSSQRTPGLSLLQGLLMSPISLQSAPVSSPIPELAEHCTAAGPLHVLFGCLATLPCSVLSPPSRLCLC